MAVVSCCYEAGHDKFALNKSLQLYMFHKQKDISATVTVTDVLLR
jgi:hypothetical protein